MKRMLKPIYKESINRIKKDIEYETNNQMIKKQIKENKLECIKEYNG